MSSERAVSSSRLPRACAPALLTLIWCHCRLLRNRVSAQQARERKKSYMATLEDKCRHQEQRLADAEQRIKTLERESSMLRTVLKNMQAGESVVPSFAGH